MAYLIDWNDPIGTADAANYMSVTYNLAYSGTSSSGGTANGSLVMNSNWIIYSDDTAYTLWISDYASFN